MSNGSISAFDSAWQNGGRNVRPLVPARFWTGICLLLSSFFSVVTIITNSHADPSVGVPSTVTVPYELKLRIPRGDQLFLSNSIPIYHGAEEVLVNQTTHVLMIERTAANQIAFTFAAKAGRNHESNWAIFFGGEPKAATLPVGYYGEAGGTNYVPFKATSTAPGGHVLIRRKSFLVGEMGPSLQNTTARFSITPGEFAGNELKGIGVSLEEYRIGGESSTVTGTLTVGGVPAPSAANCQTQLATSQNSLKSLQSSSQSLRGSLPATQSSLATHQGAVTTKSSSLTTLSASATQCEGSISALPSIETSQWIVNAYKNSRDSNDRVAVELLAQVNALNGAINWLTPAVTYLEGVKGANDAQIALIKVAGSHLWRFSAALRGGPQYAVVVNVLPLLNGF